jgi:FHA domain
MGNSSASLIGADGSHFVLDGGRPIRLGRSADNDVVISDKSVSRHHATISVEDGRCTIRDLGSQNGTFISGRRITASEVRNGERVRLGDFELTLNNSEPYREFSRSAAAPEILPDAVPLWRTRRVQAAAVTAAIAVVGFGVVFLSHAGRGVNQPSGASQENQQIGLASLTAGRSNFELPNASLNFVGDWTGSIPSTLRIPSNLITDSDLEEGIGFFRTNGQVVMSVASYTRPGVSVASMKARALDPSHVLLEEEYAQKGATGQTIMGHETVEYSPASADKLDCKVTYDYYREPGHGYIGKVVYEGALKRVSAQEAENQNEAIRAKGFLKQRELQTRLPK